MNTIFEDQKHKTTPNDRFQHEQTHIRYQTRSAADQIANVLRQITNGLRIYVRHLPVSDHERQRDVGDYAITTFRHLDCFASQRFWNTIEQAQSLALADELQKSQPGHPILRQWAFKPENRTKLAKIKFDHTDFIR